MGLVGQLDEIITGWGNLLNFDKLDEATKQLAMERGAICATCPHLVKSWSSSKVEKLIQNVKRQIDVPILTGMKCEICGCGFKAKVLSPKSTCPLRDGGDLPDGKGGYLQVKVEGKMVLGKKGFHGNPIPKWTAKG